MSWTVLLLLASLAWAQPDPSVVSKLRQGGHVLYLRPASTDFSQNDARMTSYEDCSTQRNLTGKGRGEAVVDPSTATVVGRIRVDDWQLLE